MSILWGVQLFRIHSYPSPRITHYLPIAGGRADVFIPFSQALARKETQRVSVADSSSCDDNRNVKRSSNSGILMYNNFFKRNINHATHSSILNHPGI